MACYHKNYDCLHFVYFCFTLLFGSVDNSLLVTKLKKHKRGSQILLAKRWRCYQWPWRSGHFADLKGFLLVLLYLIKLLRSQGMPESKLHVIFVALIISRIFYALSSWGGFLNSQQINRINDFLRKARRFGLCSLTCLCDVSEYLRLVDSRLFNRIQSPSHCLSHLLPPEKYHLGLCPRGHSYTLPICPNKLCKSSFIPRCLFFLWINSVFYYCICCVFCCNICICRLFS